MKKIKKIHVYTTENLPDGTQEKFLSSEAIFNPNGDLLENSLFISDGVIESKQINLYNEQFQKTKETNYSTELEFVNEADFVYNEQGKIISEKIKYTDESISVRTYTINNQVLTIELKDEDGELEDKEIHKFDDRNNLVEKISHDFNGKPKEIQTNTYNELNKLTVRTETDAKKEFITEHHYKYDEKQRITRIITVNRKREPVEIIQFVYDDLDRIVEQRISNQYLVRFAYSEDGQTITEQRFRGNGLLEFEMVTTKDADGRVACEENGLGKKEYHYEYFDA